ncbi:MAG TPA: Ig-like domain-containing protein, partial [Nannocystis sp.]
KDDEPAPQFGAAQSNVFYLNYDGVTIQYTGQEDDSSQNISQFQEFAMSYQPYGDGAKRAASSQAVKADWAKYNVVITETRPGNGSYTMCVNTPTNPYGGGVLGIAPLDCNDSQARNIVFAYHSANDEYPAATQATTMSQEIAHAFGLEHVKEPNDIMNPYNGGGDPAFLDQCFTLDAGGGQILCNAQHNMFCQGAQNSHQELIWLFGQSAPDLSPPSVNISFPADGQIFDAGSDFSITADASDDVSVTTVEIVINGQSAVVDPSPPYSQAVQSIPAGTYTVHAIATDPSANATQSATVTFTVVEGAATTDPTTDPTNVTTDPSGDPTNDPQTTGFGSDSDGDSATGFETETPTTGGDEVGGGDGSASEGGIPPFETGPALPPDYGQDDEGDSCSVAPRPVPTASLLVLLLALVGRRRRAA